MDSSLASPPTVADPGPSGPPDAQQNGSSRATLVSVFLWALAVLGLLGYLFFGSITARMWKLDTLQQAWIQDNSPRRITHIWSYQLQNLPAFAGQMAMKVVFGGALAVIVVGSAACLWLMLTDVRQGGSQPE